MKKILFLITALLVTFSFNLEMKAYEGFKITDEIVTVEGDTPYQIKYTGDITGLKFNVSSTYGAPIDTVVATVSETGEVTGLTDGIVTVRVSCNSDTDYDCMAYVSKIKDSLTLLIDKTGAYEELFEDILEEFELKKTDLATEMAKIDTTAVNVNFVRTLMTLKFDLTDDLDGRKVGEFKDYGKDFVYLKFPDYNSFVTGIHLKYNVTEDTLEIAGSVFSFQYPFGDGNYATIMGPISEKKIINFNFPAGNEADKTAVMNFAKALPINNKTYINVSANDKFSLEDLTRRQFEDSDVEKMIQAAGIESYVDLRRGELALDPFAAGHIVLGKNGVYYTAQEFKMWSTLRIVKNDTMSLVDNIKACLENNLGSNFEITVEEVEDQPGIFRIFLKDKGQLTLLDKIFNFFVPSVYADEEDQVVTLAVEEVTEEVKTNNPQTSVPSILIYTSLAIISAAGLGLTLKKKKTNN